MKNQSVVTLTTPPDESLHALQRLVAQRFNWRMLTGGEDDHPRFVIEKKVRYDLIRGWPLYALYQVVGSFQREESGQTILHYAVSGQPAVPLFYAGLTITIMLIFTLLIGSSLFGMAAAGNPLAMLMSLVPVLMIGGYSWYAYRSYQGHLNELRRFMEEFAQQQ